MFWLLQGKGRVTNIDILKIFCKFTVELSTLKKFKKHACNMYPKYKDEQLITHKIIFLLFLLFWIKSNRFDFIQFTEGLFSE